MIKKLAYTFAIILLMVICAVIADRIAAKSFKSNSVKIKVEVGDILFRSYSYILAGSSFYNFSGLPGHMAIIISEDEIVLNSTSLNNIRVVEARYYDHTKRKKRKKVGINLAQENFSEKYLGRRFLLKTHFTPSQKQKLVDFYKSNLDKPYALFAKKEETNEYNCATFVRQALLFSSDIDIDSNGGIVFFPNDIFNCGLFKNKKNRIRF